MKTIILLVALVAVVIAAPNRDAETLKYDVDVQPENYSFDFATSDGKTFSEQGQVEDLGTDDEAIVVRGSYSYIGDDGVTYAVNYIADKNGFQPQGAHIPVA